MRYKVRNFPTIFANKAAQDTFDAQRINSYVSKKNHKRDGEFGEEEKKKFFFSSVDKLVKEAVS